MLCGWKHRSDSHGKMLQHVLTCTASQAVKSNNMTCKWRKFVEAPRQLDIPWNMFLRGNLYPRCLQSSCIFWYRMMFLVRGQRKGANRSYHYQEYRRKGNCQLHSRWFRLIWVLHDWRQVLKLSSWSLQKSFGSFEIMFCLWAYNFVIISHHAFLPCLPMRRPSFSVCQTVGFNASEVQDFRELFLEMDAGYGVPWY